MNTYQLLSSPRPGDRSVRQAFLRSYTFQVKESYKERVVRSFREVNLKRSLKELNEMRKMVVLRISHRVFDGRFGVRVFRNFRLKLSSGFDQFDPLRCFALRKGSCSDELAIF